MFRKALLLLMTATVFLAGNVLVLADEGVFGQEGYNWEDPTFEVEGEIISVAVESWPPDGEEVPEATTVVLVVPRNVKAKILDTCGMIVRVVRMGWYDGTGKMWFQVHTFKPLTDQGSTYKVRVHITTEQHRFKKTGWAGRPIVAKAWL